MTKNPFYNAVLGLAYIVLIVSFITWGASMSKPEDNFMIPVAMLSLFVLSASIMGYIFLYHPILLVIEGGEARAQGVKLFLKTVGIFAIFALAAFLIATLAFA